MFRKILGTSATRVLHAFSNILILWMAANYLGKESWGLAGLIMVDVSLILLVTDMAGNSVVYFMSRRSFFSLAKWSLLWLGLVLLITIILFRIMMFIPSVYHLVIPEGYSIHIVFLVLFAAIHGLILNFFLGKEKIQYYNSLFSLQFISMFLAMAACIFVFKISDVMAYIFAFYVSYVITIITGMFLIWPIFLNDHSKQHANLREMLSYGLMTQISSIVHLLNKRLGFYFIRKFSGLGSVGIYQSAAQITEGLRIIGQSIALVQMSAISNSKDEGYAKQLTIQLLKVSVLITAFAASLLSLVPTDWFTFLLSKDFSDIKVLILVLNPGVVALAANAVLSHYFSGTGRPAYNMIASVVGLLVMLPALLVLIPKFGMIGAAAGASIAYLATVVYQFFVFRRLSGLKITELLVKRSDFQTLYLHVKYMLNVMRSKLKP